jgi:hypothetical protein
MTFILKEKKTAGNNNFNEARFVYYNQFPNYKTTNIPIHKIITKKYYHNFLKNLIEREKVFLS